MAQIFVPDNMQEREQLQTGTRSSQGANRPPRGGLKDMPRRLGLIDLVIALVLLALITLIVVAASRWTAPLTPSVVIDLSPLALPAYAGYSLLRMLLAYLLSLIFTLIYGHIAATNRYARPVMVSLLDILQSIPILSFLPGVVLALVAAFPHSNIGLELASIILIFTSQAWNMTFSFYHSARALPKDLQEYALIARLRPWQRFVRLEVPAAALGLIWNSMMSWAGGWFFLMASEQFTLGTNRSFQLPGLGSYLQKAVITGNAGALVMGLSTLIAMIILLDFFFWRPLVAWADKFKIELNSEGDAPDSPVLNILRRSALIDWLNRHVFGPSGAFFAAILNRMQPIPLQTAVATHAKPRSIFSLRSGLIVLVAAIVLAGVLYGLVSMVLLLATVSLASWGMLLLAAFATWMRTLLALAIGMAWTVPLGVAIGLSPRLSRRLQPVVQVIASIPATAFFPLILAILLPLPAGISIAAVLLMLLGTQWYVLFNVIAGAMSIPSDLKEAATIYNVTRWRRWSTLILPAIFPYLVTGMLTASGGAWNASIVSEYVTYNNHTVSVFGLGSAIAAAGASGQFALLLAGTLMMALFVVIINRLLWKRLYALAERRYTLA